MQIYYTSILLPDVPIHNPLFIEPLQKPLCLVLFFKFFFSLSLQRCNEQPRVCDMSVLKAINRSVAAKDVTVQFACVRTKMVEPQMYHVNGPLLEIEYLIHVPVEPRI